MQLPFFWEFTDDRVKKTIDVKGVSKIVTLSILKLLFSTILKYVLLQ